MREAGGASPSNKHREGVFFSPSHLGVQVADSSCSEEAQTDRTMALLALGSDSPIAGPTLKSRLMLERDW